VKFRFLKYFWEAIIQIQNIKQVTITQIFAFQPPSWIFWKPFFLQNLRRKYQMKAKRRLKNVGYYQSYLILIRHFGSSHHFRLIWQNMLLIHVADKKINRIEKSRTQKYWKMPKFCYFEFRPPCWTSDAILNPAKNFSSVKYVELKYQIKSKNRMQKNS
jgi:hypothetical protein